jgi:hypothetical protein
VGPVQTVAHTRCLIIIDSGFFWGGTVSKSPSIQEQEKIYQELTKLKAEVGEWLEIRSPCPLVPDRVAL